MNLLEYRRNRRLLPKYPQLEDIFLVSFPKSGNTWLRFLVANAFKVHFNIEREVNFFSIHDIIPDVQLSKNISNKGIFGRADMPRIIKSHAPYNPYYYRVILLVRNPKDAIVSYFHYLRDRNQISQEMTVSEFIRHPKHGVQAWIKHTSSWYLTFKQGQIIQVFLYEDFVKFPQVTLSRLIDLMGFQMSDECLSEAVKLSSKENMSRSENTHRSTYLMARNKPFVREDKALRGKDLPEEEQKYIEELTRNIANSIGYSY